MSYLTTSEHPRLIASIPTDPEPLYKSNHRPGLSEAGEPPADYKMSKAAPRTTSIIGRTFLSLGESNFLLRTFPPST